MINHSDVTRFQRILAALLAALILIIVGGQAAEAARMNKWAVAVIIGNKDYEGGIPNVEFAHNDADAFRNYVVDVLGYDPENIIDLRNTTRAQLEAAFSNERTHEGGLWRYLDPRGRSEVMVYYSGHGVPGLKDKQGYLLPVNADPDAPEINGYLINSLFANLAKLEAKSIVDFLDACFSGNSAKGMLIRATSGIAIAPRLPGRSSARMSIVTASRGDQVASWDEKARHGLFTRHLMDALYGAADGEDYGNGDQKISLEEVQEYLDHRMTRAARRIYGRHQNAWVSGEGQTVLASVPAAAVRCQPAPEATVEQAPDPAPQPEPVAVASAPPAQEATASQSEPATSATGSLLGDWVLEIGQGSGNSGCLAEPVSARARLTELGLSVSIPQFTSVSGELENRWKGRISGHFMQGRFYYCYKMSYAGGSWSGDWTVLGDQNEGIGCAGTIAMRK